METLNEVAEKLHSKAREVAAAEKELDALRDQRDELIVRLVKGGVSGRKVGRIANLTDVRVQAIVKRPPKETEGDSLTLSP